METFDVRSGVRIHVEKRIPAGAGMGGGSSDAATVLIGLNRLFGLGLSRSALMELGERLGADVPFFIFGRTGFVEGIGEIITPLEIPPASYAVIWPGRGISTAEIFAAPNLTRDTKSLKIDILSGKALEIWPNMYGHNDLQNVAQELEHRVTEGLGMLACGTHDARMTGSGSAVFGVIADPCSYRLPQLPDGWDGYAFKVVYRGRLIEVSSGLQNRVPRVRILLPLPAQKRKRMGGNKCAPFLFSGPSLCYSDGFPVVNCESASPRPRKELKSWIPWFRKV